MRPGTRIISSKNIELEIYNTFELFNKEKNIGIADFIEKLDISPIINNINNILIDKTIYTNLYFNYLEK